VPKLACLCSCGRPVANGLPSLPLAGLANTLS
jgi:hypothetical protein